MELQLEDLDYQRRAIAAVVGVLAGQIKNTFDNSNLFGIQGNVTTLTPEQIEQNKKRIISENGIDEADAKLSSDSEICIEMETGTGKTLVYLHTAYALYKEYRLTKFIIFVPSIAIKEGVLRSFEDFRKQLGDLYGFDMACFEYDSGKLFRLRHFIEETQPQIMVMTIQSIASDDRIINQPERDDSFLGLSFLEALGKCCPVVIMDEPQEGMDTVNAVGRIATLNPLVKIRYSATHKVIKNLLFRLTPFSAYREGLVKKIEVLSVAEKNDEATLKIEFSNVQTKARSDPKAKLTLWRSHEDTFKWKPTNWLKVGDNLGEKSSNISYRDYTIERIWKGLLDQKHHLKFTNGVELTLNERNGDLSGLFRLQLHWLIRRHFQKKLALASKGIKCLSLIFIDKVDNYVRDNGLIKAIFEEEYSVLHQEFFGTQPTSEQVRDCQGYYFAKTGGEEYTDSENAMLKNKKIFDEILRDKSALIDLANPREFIFSHSALGVGWDNPNIFNIATLNESYSDIKKRQEIGRGLRICRDQNGRRIYDEFDVKEGEEINLLTIIPNETYETFAMQYQAQIAETYGTVGMGSALRKAHKGQPSKNRVRLSKRFESEPFKMFWEKLAQKTYYTVAFDEKRIIERAVEELNRISIADYEAEVILTRIRSIALESIASDEIGRETENLRAAFSPFDLVEELSENTALSYPAVLEIVNQLESLTAVVRNPAKFLAIASARIREIELNEMLRTLSYHPTGDSIPLEEFLEVIDTFLPVEPTLNRGIYDGVPYSSSIERAFTRSAEADNEVVCFLKLPKFYRIPTPIGGFYEPDFGLVLKRRKLKSDESHEYYFVIETKSTNNLEDRKSITESERLKIKCALKHFDALGIEAKLEYVPYIAPIKTYDDFKAKVPNV